MSFFARKIQMLDDDAVYGRFVHLEDPEGNPIELWEPIAKDIIT